MRSALPVEKVPERHRLTHLARLHRGPRAEAHLRWLEAADAAVPKLPPKVLSGNSICSSWMELRPSLSRSNRRIRDPKHRCREAVAGLGQVEMLRIEAQPLPDRKSTAALLCKPSFA